MAIRWPSNGVKYVRPTEKCIELRPVIQVNAELQHTPRETEGADADQEEADDDSWCQYDASEDELY